MALGWLPWRAWFPFDAAAVGHGTLGAWLHKPLLRHFEWPVAGVALIMALGWLWWRGRFPFDAVVAGAVGMALLAEGWPWQRAWFSFDAVVAAAVGMAREALGDIGHRPSLCLARHR